MDPFNDGIERQLSDALDHWNALDRHGLQNVKAAELSDLHTTLAEAIQFAPITSPYPPRAGAVRADAGLRDEVRHLVRVARALRGFRHGGTVQADGIPLHFQGAVGCGLFRVHITWPVEGWVTYIHVVNREFKKAGKTGDGETFGERMNGSYNCLRKVIACGPPYLGDPWKRHVPLTILTGQEVELWAKAQPTHQAAKDEEDTLNEFYRGEWSKEGWKQRVRRPKWPADLNRKRAKLDS